ncbi:SDR family oxidoreductase [Sphingomonas sp. CL5.1]|uniref:SDR family oxidoreductase n=1 Tax=Sphingomonas sp. CL5.1 TaxID=2653203 RepID=UPI0015832F9B|nr:SDR family oxidoreductase [Sphingomonas sp. CL5.1]QKS02268.1 SDR family oxidoreductase [Sphingomonas sp. CL5.1]
MLQAFPALAGRRVLVVGGSSGIGLAVARSAAAGGARMTIAARDPGRLAEAVAGIGGGATGEVLDMTDAARVEAFLAAAAPFDHIVVTAAALRSGPIRDLPLAAAQATFASKFWGPYLVARFARFNDDGSLTLVSGAAGRRPRAGRGPVAAACAAIEALTKVLAAELAPVRVNCVSPGLTDTAMLRAAGAGVSVPPGLPVKRIGTPEEVAFQILSCAANPYMTGAIVDIDGGMSLV